MTKLLGVVVLGVLFSFRLGAQTVDIEKEQKFDGRAGPVLSIREEAYGCTGDPLEKPWRVTEVFFDRAGNAIRRIFYKRDGSLDREDESTFDQNGRQTGWSQAYTGGLDNNTVIHRHAVYTYRSGKLTQSLVYQDGKFVGKISYFYDKRGNKIREDSTGSNYASSQTFKFDVANRLVEQTDVSPSSRTRLELVNDAAGNVIKEIRYVNDLSVYTYLRTFKDKKLVSETVLGPGSNMSLTRNEYDLAGDLVATTLENDSVQRKTTIEYSQPGKIRSKDAVTVAKKDGKLLNTESEPKPGRILERYDNEGRQTERLLFDPDGTLYLRQLSIYDQAGNQIRGLETARGSKSERDMVYEFDSHGNEIKASCQKVSSTGQMQQTLAARTIIKYF